MRYYVAQEKWLGVGVVVDVGYRGGAHRVDNPKWHA